MPDHIILSAMRLRARYLSITVVFFAFWILAGCEVLQNSPEALGREGEIVVVLDSARWNGRIGDALQEELAPWIGTLPAPEREFRIRLQTIASTADLNAIKKLKNVVLTAPLTDSTAEAALLLSQLDDDVRDLILEGRSAVIERHDRWRSKQLVYYVIAATPEAVVEALHQNGAGMRYAFNKITRERVTREMFSKGRQQNLEDTLMAHHEFAVNVQHDYFMAIDTTDFVWLRRVVSSESWRSLFISYTEDHSPADLTPEWIYETRKQLVKQWISGNVGGYPAIDYRRDLATENIDFLGRFGYETRGLWHMIDDGDDGKTIEYGMGGPFITYTFYDQETGRIYMIDGMVFAPGFPKKEFLRHMEAIAYTFRTSFDVQRAKENKGSGS